MSVLADKKKELASLVKGIRMHSDDYGETNNRYEFTHDKFDFLDDSSYYKYRSSLKKRSSSKGDRKTSHTSSKSNLKSLNKSTTLSNLNLAYSTKQAKTPKTPITHNTSSILKSTSNAKSRPEFKVISRPAPIPPVQPSPPRQAVPKSTTFNNYNRQPIMERTADDVEYIRRFGRHICSHTPVELILKEDRLIRQSLHPKSNHYGLKGDECDQMYYRNIHWMKERDAQIRVIKELKEIETEIREKIGSRGVARDRVLRSGSGSRVKSLFGGAEPGSGYPQHHHYYQRNANTDENLIPEYPKVDRLVTKHQLNRSPKAKKTSKSPIRIQIEEDSMVDYEEYIPTPKKKSKTKASKYSPKRTLARVSESIDYSAFNARKHTLYPC